MNIKFKGKDKAITSFVWTNIPPLVVLTGVNGSGKTQLLNMIRNHCANGISLNEGYTNKQNGNEIIIDNIEIERNGVLFWSDRGTNINLEQSKFGYQDLKFIVTFLTNYIKNLNSENEELLQQNENEDYDLGKNKLKHTLNQKKDKIIDHIVISAKKVKEELSPEDISYHFPEDILLEDFDLFNQDSLDFIFFIYLYKKIAFKNGKTSIDVGKTAPWEILNEVLLKANLPYQVTHPSEDLINPIFRNALNDVDTTRYRVQLVEPINNEEIGFNNLSSGERIIASLALLLYYTQNRNQKKKLLILDEPDAHLHPTLTKQFFDVVKDVIIDKYNGRVIMTTHSPSTIALAPEEAIYLMNKTGVRVVKSTKDIALNILSFGLPFFSVNYENRRQVFVESPNDVSFYEKIYRKLSSYLEPDISLSFISSGETRTDKNGIKIANCDQVKNITKKLRETGNNLIWGIIDWDKNLDNTTKENVIVIGNGNRYSIENYILDPLLISALLLREKIITRKDIGLNEDENYTDFKNFESSKLQFIVDFYISKVGINISDKNDVIETVTLLNKREIEIPLWYLHYQGHQLEDIIINVFPKLNEIKRNKEEALKINIVDKIIDDIPEVISIDFLKTFTEIQK